MVRPKSLQRYTDPLIGTAKAAQSPLFATTKNLRCLACHHDFVVAVETPFDNPIECGACGAQSEVRLLHEAWCSDQRAAFEKPQIAEDAFPRLKLVLAR